MGKAIRDKFKKATLDWEKDINKEAVKIMAKLKLDNRIEKVEKKAIIKKQAITTVENHKMHVRSKAQCRLINPNKNHRLGRLVR